MPAFDIKIGRLSTRYEGNEELPTVLLCEDQEPKNLTSPKYTLNSGEPFRVINHDEFKIFYGSCQAVNQLVSLVDQTEFNGTYCLPLNSLEIKNIVLGIENCLKSNKFTRPEDADRARWLVFWVKESIKKYEDSAGMEFGNKVIF